jgi:hypothetical protein
VLRTRQIIPVLGLAATIATSAIITTRLDAEREARAGSPVAAIDAFADGMLPRPIAGGNFEASGVAGVSDGSGVLFVDDGRNHELFWMELAPDGTQRGKALPVTLNGSEVTDMEGLTSDGRWFYVVGSQSKRTGVAGDGLVRFMFDPATRRIDHLERMTGLKAWLAAHVPELAGTAERLGDRVLNIEAVAWDPGRERLLLGLRAPVVEGSALIVPLKFKDGTAPLSAGNLKVDGAVIRLPLAGAGIRSLEYDKDAGAFRLITGAGFNREDRDFKILEWNGEATASQLREIARISAKLKPEGLTAGTLNGRPASLVLFDTGRFAWLP